MEYKEKHKDSATKLDLLDYNLTKLTEISDRIVKGGIFWDFQFRTVNKWENKGTSVMKLPRKLYL